MCLCLHRRPSGSLANLNQKLSRCLQVRCLPHNRFIVLVAGTALYDTPPVVDKVKMLLDYEVSPEAVQWDKRVKNGRYEFLGHPLEFLQGTKIGNEEAVVKWASRSHIVFKLGGKADGNMHIAEKEKTMLTVSQGNQVCHPKL